MKKKFEKLHPLLDALLTKLSNPKYSMSECWGERHVWVKAGCPVDPEPEIPDDYDFDR